MENQELIDYIKNQLQQGVTEEQIRSSLMSHGWQEQEIDSAFSLVSDFSYHGTQVPSSSPTISSLPGVVALLVEALTLYQQRLVTFLGVSLLPIFIIFVLFFVPFVIFQFVVFKDAPLYDLQFFLNNLFLFGFLLSILGILIFLSQAWGQIALIYAIKDSHENIGVIEAYRRGWRKLLSYSWVVFLVGFLIIGGYFLFVIPGIIFGIWFSFALYILVVEDLHGMNALLKSKEYVRGRWGSVFWRFLFIWFFNFIIFFVISFLGGQALGHFVFVLFLTPLAMIYSYLMYRYLRTLKGDFVYTPTVGKKAIFIVIALLGYLLFFFVFFSIFFSNIRSATLHSRDGMRKADIQTIRVYLDLYYSEYNRYPFSLDELSPRYLSKIPVDPLTNTPYSYQLLSNGTDYEVCANFEFLKKRQCFNSQR